MRGHVICSSGAGTKHQYNQSKDRQQPRSIDWKAQNRWFEHKPAEVVENDEVELYRDLIIQTDTTVAHNRPDIILVEKATQNGQSIIFLFKVTSTEDWKVEKYLAFEVKKIHHVETALLSVVIGAL